MGNKILIFADYFFPGYKAGGPIRSIMNIVDILKPDAEILLITTNKDWSVDTPYTEYPTNKWVTVLENVQALYLDIKQVNPERLISEIRQIKPSCIFLNSLYSPFSRIVFKLLNNHKIIFKVAVAIRGELAPKAIKIRWYLKIPYLLMLRLNGLAKKIIWLPTNAHELSQIKHFFGENIKFEVIDNIPRNEHVEWTPLVKEKNELKLIFLSRIDEMKNLVLILKVLSKIKQGNIIFDIYGSNKDEAYLNLCRSLIENLSSNIKVNIKAPINSYSVVALLQNYHFLVQPSFGENFGHSIFEAFLSGIPVIISDRTPWKDLEQKKIGWDLDIKDEDKWLEVLTHCIEMNDNEYKILSRNSLDFSTSYRNNNKNVQKIKSFFAPESKFQLAK